MPSVREVEEKIDINEFIEKVLKDQDDKHIEQHIIHEVWQAHIQWCLSNNKFCGIIAPWGHGKTEQCIIARALKFIGENNNIRMKLISNNDESALARVESVKKYIEEDEDYHEVFPKVKPQTQNKLNFKKKKKFRTLTSRINDSDSSKYDKWAGHKILVQRKGKSKDKTLEAYGILASGVGGRADVLFFDDIVDLDNAIIKPEKQKSVKQSYNTWIGRLDTGGWALYVATPWANNDNTADQLKNKRYSWCIMNITESMNYIELRWKNIDKTHPCYTGNESDRLPLWEKKKSKEELLLIKPGVGSISWARGYLCKPPKEGELYFASIDNCIDKNISVADWLEYARVQNKDSRRKILFFGGIDISSQSRPGNCIFTMGMIEGTNQLVVIDIKVGNWSNPVLASKIVETYKQFYHTIIYSENNATQGALIEWIRYNAKEGREIPLPIEGFMTGANKSHPDIGLGSIEVEFKNNMWLIPAKDIANHDIDNCMCEWCQWIRNMKMYPYAVMTDSIMASWFTREAARFATGFGGVAITEEDRMELKKVRSIVGMDTKSQDKLFDSISNADKYRRMSITEQRSRDDDDKVGMLSGLEW